MNFRHVTMAETISVYLNNILSATLVELVVNAITRHIKLMQDNLLRSENQDFSEIKHLRMIVFDLTLPINCIL